MIRHHPAPSNCSRSFRARHHFLLISSQNLAYFIIYDSEHHLLGTCCLNLFGAVCNSFISLFSMSSRLDQCYDTLTLSISGWYHGGGPLFELTQFPFQPLFVHRM